MKVMVAMSGGVDSAAAAAVLAEEGHSLAGVHLKLYAGADAAPPGQRTCCSLTDAEDARAAAYKLGLPFYVFNMTDLFEEQVMRRFCAAYLSGETPNPCVDCNRYIKFEALLKKARALGYDGVATGHYVRREAQNGRILLKTGRDAHKDQSYVLYMLTQEQLRHSYFPLGNFTKAQSRAIAEAHGFLNAQKPDSQDICFVPGGDYGAFLEEYTGKKLAPGDFLSPDGRRLGRHKGAARYTIGQRKGLGLALPAPGYVCNIDTKKNTVTVGEEALLFSKACDVRDINLIACDAIGGSLRCSTKVRYRAAAAPCTVTQTGTDSLHIEFDTPQRAITPGQAAVLYDGEVVLGGGKIA